MPDRRRLVRSLERLRTSAVHGLWRRAVAWGAVTPDHPLARRYAAFGARTWLAFPPGDRLGESRIEEARLRREQRELSRRLGA